MKLLVVALLALLVVGVCENAPRKPMVVSQLTADTPIEHSGVLRNDESYREILPPERFQKDGAAIFVWTKPETVVKLCGGVTPEGREAIACTLVTGKGVPVLVVPNPCLFASKDLYAAILCHEEGHVAGWPREHGG